MQNPLVNHTQAAPGPNASGPQRTFDYPSGPIISYAQTHEDVLLWRALHNVEGGFYIDVGAHDPTDLSVTRAFYDHGWHGINVEPDPYYAEKLRHSRPRDLTLQVALGAAPARAMLYDFGATGLSTLVQIIADEHKARGFEAAEHSVEVTTLGEITRTLGDQPIHFLKIDVEGYEYQVLKGADFATFRPWIVLLEAVTPLTAIPDSGEWEPLLLNAGYQYVYFDGLNRYYVADERSELKACFTVPVSIVDPFSDAKLVSMDARLTDQQREIAGLESDVAASRQELARYRARHEVPSLGGGPATPIAVDSKDSSGLLRLVEAQSTDLVKLRRALVSALAVAAQRLEIIQSVPGVEASAPIRPSRASEWALTTMIAEVTRVQDAISGAIGASRWRRIGHRLGLSKRLDWERAGWQVDLSQYSGNAAAADPNLTAQAIVALQAELRRLHGLLDRLRRSRWRKLGHTFGLTRRRSWESGAWPDPLLSQSFPQEAEVSSAISSSHPAGSRDALDRSSYVGFIEYTNQRFLEECRNFAVDVIFDIGANIGQFAQGIRSVGYLGQIISFEPLSEAHSKLMETAAADPLWDVAERCAVGAEDGVAEINIAGNSYSSSLLPMLDRHRDAAPQSVYQGAEQCTVVSLDSFIERTFSDPTTRFGLKMDTQGFEAQVLAGLRRHHERIKVIVCEMSLAPLYSNGPTMSELCRLLAELGYRCVALGPEFEDPRTGELLQANGVFVRAVSQA